MTEKDLKIIQTLLLLWLAAIVVSHLHSFSAIIDLRERVKKLEAPMTITISGVEAAEQAYTKGTNYWQQKPESPGEWR